MNGPLVGEGDFKAIAVEVMLAVDYLVSTIGDEDSRLKKH